MNTLEQRTMARVSVHLVPFLIVCYFVAYLDRVNVIAACASDKARSKPTGRTAALGVSGLVFLSIDPF
jgi:hypothetical protein